MGIKSVSCVNKTQSGVGLLEVLVTILITVVGLVGLASMQLRSLRANQSANQQAQAIWMVSDMANRIRANSEGNYATPEFSCGTSRTPPSTLVACSPYYQFNRGSGSQVAALSSCTDDQLAEFDRWEVLCGFSQNEPAGELIYEGAGAFLANPNMTIDDLTGGNFRITLTWSIRSDENAAPRTDQVQMVVYQ